MSGSKEARTLNRFDKNKTVRAKIKKSIPKPVLCTPYKVEWPIVDPKLQDGIIAYLKKFFQENNLCYEPLDKASLKNISKSEKKNKQKEHALKTKSSEVSNLRGQLAIGVNEVTKHLENKNMSLVIVDRSSPWQLHRHLIQLSTIRECPAIAIDQLCETLSPLLSVSRLCVLGVKTFREGDSKMFQPLLDLIAPLCPAIEVPWLEAECQLLEIKNRPKNIEEVKCDDVEGGEDRKNVECRADGEDSAAADDSYGSCYIRKEDCEAEPVCEIIDVPFDEFFNFGIHKFLEKSKANKPPENFVPMNKPTTNKRFREAEVVKIQKNDFKKRKLNR